MTAGARSQASLADRLLEALAELERVRRDDVGLLDRGHAPEERGGLGEVIVEGRRCGGAVLSGEVSVLTPTGR